LRAISVDDQHAPVEWRQSQHQASGERVVGAEYRCHEAAAAAPRKFDRIAGIGIGHDTAHRPKRLNRMHGARRAAVFAGQQRRSNECACFRIGTGRMQGNLSTK
jgi:hypothetical protein